MYYNKYAEKRDEMSKALNHFKTITHHRHQVIRNCFKAGIPWQGLKHDLSKYSWTEFSEGARYWQGTRSPNNAEREQAGFSTAWLHHKGRNKHHYEYWLDYNTRAASGRDHKTIVPCKMPGRYVVEMFMDRIAACKVYKGDAYKCSDPWDYYVGGKTWQFLHPETAALLEKLLKMLRDEGEEVTFAYIRAHLHKRF